MQTNTQAAMKDTLPFLIMLSGGGNLDWQKGMNQAIDYMESNGWNQITDITVQNWGAKECQVTTIDGCILRFHEAVESPT